MSDTSMAEEKRDRIPSVSLEIDTPVAVSTCDILLSTTKNLMRQLESRDCLLKDGK